MNEFFEDKDCIKYIFAAPESGEGDPGHLSDSENANWVQVNA